MRAFIALILLWPLATGPQVATAQESTELRASIHADVRFTDGSGHELSEVKTGELFGIEARLSDATTGGPVVLAEPPFAWLRPVEAGNSNCTEAGRSFRATGRLPFGAISLNGILLASLAVDNSLVVIDPKLDLATSNMTAAVKLNERPSALFVHPKTRMVYYAASSSGEIGVLSPQDGHTRTVASALGRVTDVTWTNHGLLVLAQAGNELVLLALDGTQLWRKQLTRKARSFLDGGEEAAALLYEDGGIQVVARKDGKPGQEFAPAVGQAKAAAFHGASREESLVILDGRTGRLQLYFLDAAGVAAETELAGPASRLALSPDGRFAFAFDPNSPVVSIVSVASGKLIQAVSLDIEGPSQGVREFGFVGGMALFISSDSNTMFKLVMASIKPAQGPEITKVRLGTGTPPSATDDARLLSPIPQTNNAFVIHPLTYTAFVVDDLPSSFNAPPMTAVRLRGGVPSRLEVINRSFTAASRGVYRNSAILPFAGDYELVMTTGILGMTACTKIKAAGGQERRRSVVLTISPSGDAWRLSAQVAETLFFTLMDGDNPVPLTLPARMRITAMPGGWRSIGTISTAAGVAQASVQFPQAGDYLVEVLDLPASVGTVAPMQIKVGP